MSTKAEGTISIIAALIVLFSTMLDPRVSVALAVIVLVGLGIYNLSKKAGGTGSEAVCTGKQTEHKENGKGAILSLMESGNQPLMNEHVRMMLGISESTATRYFDELEKEGKIRQVGKTGSHVAYEKI